jgi:broad specificity phosphatase PhoE
MANSAFWFRLCRVRLSAVSLLALIRHGQARVGGPDYDVLSERGIEQAALIGSAWAALHAPWHALYMGPRRRHRDTVEHMRSGARRHGVELPEAQPVDAFDEVSIAPLIAQALSRVLPSCPDLLQQLGAGELDDEARAALKHVGGILDNLFMRWARGESFEGVETFEDFTLRVQRALREVMRREGRGRRVLVITSGGPVSVCMRLALGLSPEKAVSLLRSLANASITELHYTPDRMGIARFNSVGHLPPDIVTIL